MPQAAAEVLPLDERPAVSLRQASQLAVDRLGSAQGLRPGSFSFLRRLAVPGGEVLRFRQLHQGLPVLHAEAKVVALGGKLVAVSSRLADPAALALLDLDPRPRLQQQQAVAQLKAARPDFKVRGGRLVIATSPLWGAREAWLLDVVRPVPWTLLKQLVDARSGELLGGWPALAQAQGRVYSTNPISGSLVTEQLLGLTNAYGLDGSYAMVYRCWMAENSNDSGCDREAQPDSNGDYLYSPQEPSLEDPFSEVQAYYHVDKMYRWLAGTFGFSRSGSQQIFTVVNFQVEQNGVWSGYPNAGAGDIDGDGKGDLLFGEAEHDFAYDADVIYHEFGHLVVEEQAGLTMQIDQLGFNAMATSINEGYADLFSCLMTGDPTVGEYAIPDTTYLRSLEGQASCPGDLTGESHEDSMIWSQAIWSVRSQTSQKQELANVLYTALAGLTPLADFQEASTMITQVAQQQAPGLASLLTEEFNRRGYAACSRLVPLPQGQEKQGSLYGTSLMPQVSEFPNSIQYRIDVPASATRLDVELSVPYPWPGVVGAYLRQGQPVAYSPTNVTADLRVPGGTANFSLQLSGSQPLLQPGTSYYLLAFNENADPTNFTVRYTTDAPATPDLGPGPGSDLGLSDGVWGFDGGLAADQGGWLPGMEGSTHAVGGQINGGCSVSTGPCCPSLGLLLLFGLLVLGLGQERSRRR